MENAQIDPVLPPLMLFVQKTKQALLDRARLQEDTQKPQPARRKKQISKRPKVIRTYYHSLFQRRRISRGSYEEMFLIEVTPQEQNQQVRWTNKVYSQTGSIYDITLSSILICTCQDYQKYKKPCKHIYFMIIQVAQSDQICDRMRNSNKLPRWMLDDLDSALRTKLTKFISPSETVNSVETQEEEETCKQCNACLKVMRKPEEGFKCPQCVHWVHAICLKKQLLVRMEGLQDGQQPIPMCWHCRCNIKESFKAYEEEFGVRRDLGDNEHLSKLTKENIHI